MMRTGCYFKALCLWPQAGTQPNNTEWGFSILLSLKIDFKIALHPFKMLSPTSHQDVSRVWASLVV